MNAEEIAELLTLSGRLQDGIRERTALRIQIGLLEREKAAMREEIARLTHMLNGKPASAPASESETERFEPVLLEDLCAGDRIQFTFRFQNYEADFLSLDTASTGLRLANITKKGHPRQTHGQENWVTIRETSDLARLAKA